MSGTCPFCSIASHQAPASIVHEDADAVAFLAAHPIRPGHVLVVPRVHASDVLDVDPAIYASVFQVVRTLGHAVRRAFSPKRVGIAVAGFDVPHAHVHVVPMAEYHDVTSRALLEGTLVEATRSELDEAAGRIRRALHE